MAEALDRLVVSGFCCLPETTGENMKASNRVSEVVKR